MFKFPTSLPLSQGFRPSFFKQLSRESSDNLLLLLALLLTLASHYPYLNWSISLTSLGFLMWRAYLAFAGRALPRRWILNAVSLASIALVVFTYKAFLGRDPGVALLVLLVSAKTLEMHLRRDSNVVLFLAYFCLLISFFHTQALSSSLLVILALFFLLTTHLSFQYGRLYPPLWTRMKAALKLMGLALPMMLICFVPFSEIDLVGLLDSLSEMNCTVGVAICGVTKFSGTFLCTSASLTNAPFAKTPTPTNDPFGAYIIPSPSYRPLTH